MSTLFVVFFSDPPPLLICSRLLTNTSRTPPVTYEKQLFPDAGIRLLTVLRWEYLALDGKKSNNLG